MARNPQVDIAHHATKRAGVDHHAHGGEAVVKRCLCVMMPGLRVEHATHPDVQKQWTPHGASERHSSVEILPRVVEELHDLGTDANLDNAIRTQLHDGRSSLDDAELLLVHQSRSSGSPTNLQLPGVVIAPNVARRADTSTRACRRA